MGGWPLGNNPCDGFICGQYEVLQSYIHGGDDEEPSVRWLLH